MISNPPHLLYSTKRKTHVNFDSLHNHIVIQIGKWYSERENHIKSSTTNEQNFITTTTNSTVRRQSIDSSNPFESNQPTNNEPTVKSTSNRFYTFIPILYFPFKNITIRFSFFRGVLVVTSLVRMNILSWTVKQAKIVNSLLRSFFVPSFCFVVLEAAKKFEAKQNIHKKSFWRKIERKFPSERKKNFDRDTRNFKVWWRSAKFEFLENIYFWKLILGIYFYYI